MRHSRIIGKKRGDRRDSTLEQYTLTDAAREDYLKSFEGERFAESMRYVRTY
jgi:hypothetical protein